tara:strand:+ start:4724 stop:5104 length:381 start_codon:yes stop_codon:yes gene_type:complete
MLKPLHRKKIQRLGERSAYPTLVEEVEQSLAKCQATLFSNDDLGIVVAKPFFHQDKFGMLVWVAIGGKCKNAIERYLPAFEAMAKRSKGKFIMFETRRKGFRRLAPKFGFIETHPRGGFFVFKKEV